MIMEGVLAVDMIMEPRHDHGEDFGRRHDHGGDPIILVRANICSCCAGNSLRWCGG